ncbi:MAG: radical SAM protein [Bdellovibrionaceae bacterium]|nr:radical SAM protein [Bdellovibrionales bacterium]MCB9086161.1 radical SAM protein [Pseudobdellovibrionaceae bacterium]
MSSRPKLPPPTLKRVYTPYEMSRAQGDGRLVGVALRLPSDCNFDCLYCNAKEIEGTIYHEDVLRFVDESIALGIKSVSFVGEGEPFLYNRAMSPTDPTTYNLLNLVDYLDKRGIHSIIYSNTTYIDKDVAKYLFERDTVVVAKQNALSDDIQEKLTGPGTAKICRDGIKILEEAGFTSGPGESRLSIHTVVTKMNIHEIPDMWIEWRKRNIVPMVQILEMPSNKANNDFLQVHPNELKDLFLKLSILDRKMFGYSWIPRPPIAPYGCTVCSTSAGLRPNGDISICAYTDNILGNIMKDTLVEILNREETKAVRDIDNNLKGFCVGCSINEKLKCSGCRAHQVSLTGDVFASYEFCWNNPEHKETARNEAKAKNGCSPSSPETLDAAAMVKQAK